MSALSSDSSFELPEGVGSEFQTQAAAQSPNVVPELDPGWMRRPRRIGIVQCEKRTLRKKRCLSLKRSEIYAKMQNSRVQQLVVSEDKDLIFAFPTSKHCFKTELRNTQPKTFKRYLLIKRQAGRMWSIAYALFWLEQRRR